SGRDRSRAKSLDAAGEERTKATASQVFVTTAISQNGSLQLSRARRAEPVDPADRANLLPVADPARPDLPLLERGGDRVRGGRTGGHGHRRADSADRGGGVRLGGGCRAGLGAA